MPRGDADDALRQAAERRQRAEESRQLAREQDREIVEAYEADRQALFDRLLHAGERVLELVKGAPEGGGTESILVEHRSFRRDLVREGWLLEGDASFGPRVVLVPDGAVLYCDSPRPSSLGAVAIKERGSLRDWIGRRLATAQVRGDRWPLREDALLHPNKPPAMSKQELDRELRRSLRRIEQRVMDTYARILDQAGVDLSLLED